jgi:hypothetical protein
MRVFTFCAYKYWNSGFVAYNVLIFIHMTRHPLREKLMRGVFSIRVFNVSKYSSGQWRQSI